MEENLDLSTRPGTHLLQEVEVVYKPGKRLSTAPRIMNSGDAYHYIRGFFAPFVSHHEEVWAILLNSGHRIIGCSQIAKGGIDCTTVDVRIIFQTLLLTHATGLILVHNHPGGATRPSVQDKMLTDKVAKAGKILDIKLLDHLIVTSENYLSFADEGILP